MLSNLVTPSPETMAVQKEKKTADRNARNEELERLRGLLDDYTNERKIRDLLPDDVESIKKFLKTRISAIQSQPTMTEDQLLALKGTKESQNYDNFLESVKIRAKFHTEFATLKDSYQKEIDGMKAKGAKVPNSMYLAVKICDEALAWLKKSQFETPDVYDDKRHELKSRYTAQADGASLGDPSAQSETAVDAQAKARQEFSFGGLLKEVSAYVGGYLAIFLIITGMILGSSLATNLNLYKNWAFRILYAIYGAIFFFVVIPYVLLYRWAFNGHRPKFYSLIPLFPYHWNSRFAQILFGWISYRPDDEILALREWEKEQGM